MKFTLEFEPSLQIATAVRGSARAKRPYDNGRAEADRDENFFDADAVSVRSARRPEAGCTAPAWCSSPEFCRFIEYGDVFPTPPQAA